MDKELSEHNLCVLSATSSSNLVNLHFIEKMISKKQNRKHTCDACVEPDWPSANIVGSPSFRSIYDVSQEGKTKEMSFVKWFNLQDMQDFAEHAGWLRFSIAPSRLRSRGLLVHPGAY